MPEYNDNHPRPIVVGVGELLWDCFPDERRPGGAPANVAFHAQQLGATGLVCSRVGQDEPDDALVAHLARHGLSTDALQRDADHPTGSVRIELSEGGEPTYTIPENVAWDHMAFDGSWRVLIQKASAICFGTLAQRHAHSRDTIQRCLREAGSAILIYDINLRPPWYSCEIIEISLRQCHVVKLNDEEAPVLAEMLSLSIGSLERIAAELGDRFEIQTVCITRGSRGCLAFSGGQRVDLPGRTVQVADTVGSGDAFTAALACGLVWGWSLERTASLANAVGTLVATRRGAMPELRSEYAELVARFAE